MYISLVDTTIISDYSLLPFESKKTDKINTLMPNALIYPYEVVN